ncbi:S-layer family protein [Nostoc sp. 106C]|uniref:beta strand repeat-containing protein n=1 Tax=Nostoc sp. 106C TaxID=1932667 RepID=UPI001412BEB0|nr:S-layer family protein [Nostoc sp. 106C]
MARNKLLVQGNESIDILALNHRSSGLFSGGDMVLRSAIAVGGDAHFWSGGNFRIEKLDSSLGNLFSPYDPIIRASGDVSFAEYEGASLHILAGGSVNIPGTIYASSRDNTDFIRENVTLSDGKTNIVIDSSDKPTLDIRAGTTVVSGPSGVTGSGIGFNPAPSISSSSNKADIQIGAVYTSGETEGLVFISNQYLPNSASGNIQIGNIDISTENYLKGGTAIIDSRGDITFNDKFNPFVENGNGGSITLLANNNITTHDIYALSNLGNAGTITLNTANGNINIIGNLNSQSALASGKAGNGGAITLNAPKGSINVIGDLASSSSSNGINQASQAADGGDIALNAGKFIDITGNLDSSAVTNSSTTGNAGAISLTATGGSINIKGKLNASADGTFPNPRIVVRNARIGNGGAVTLNASDRIEITGDIYTGSGIIFGNPFGILHTGNVGDGGSVKLNAPNGIKVMSGIDSSVHNDNNNGTDTDFRTSKSDAITGSGGAVTITTSNGNIDIGDLSSYTSARWGNVGNGGALTLAAPNGSIKVSGTFSILSRAEVSFGNARDGGTVNLTAAGNIEVKDNIDSSSFSAEGNSSNGGAINLISAQGDIKTGGLSSHSLVAYTGDSGNAGEVNLTALNGSITTGDVFAFSSTSPLLNLQGTSGRGGAITLTAKKDVTTKSLIGYGGTGSGNITVNTTGAFSSANSIISTNTNGPGRSGDIEIRASSVTLSDGSQVSTSTPTEGKGGNVSIIAPDFVSLSGSSPQIVRFAWTQQGLFAAPGPEGQPAVKLSGYIPPLAFSRQFGQVQFPTGLYTQTSGQNSNAGNAGVISIQTGKLLVQDQAVIAATTFGSGDGGNIFIETNDVTVRNGSIVSGVGPQALGDSGNIDIQSRFLNLSEGGVLQTLTLGGGKAGNIEVRATDGVQISGFNSTSGLASGLLSGTEGLDSGQGGNISVTTPQLQILDKAVLSARTLGSANAGDIILKVTDNIALAGKDTGLFANTEPGSTGNGGNIIIDPRILTIFDGAQIAVDSQGEGVSGNIQLAAGFLTLNNGSISAETSSNTGGNITLNLQDLLLLRNGSQISTNAGIDKAIGTGDGGNITINSPLIVAVPSENSNISANASKGNGGRVNITTQGIFGIEPRSQPTQLSDITASSESGVQGFVTINTPDVDPARGLLQLPTNLVDASQQIVSSCTPRRQKVGHFIATGRGGLPLSPNEPLRGSAVITDWVIPAATDRVTEQLTPSPQPITEAQGWIKSDRGDVILVGQSPNMNYSRTLCN